MEWQQGSAQTGSYKNATEAIADIGCVKANAGKNILIFFVTSETKQSYNVKAAPTLTPQAKMTETAETKTFNTDTYKVLIGSECFECYKIDVTNVTPKENRYLCSLTAPAVALIDRQGNVKALLTQNQVTEARVFSAMARICAADGINLVKIVTAASSYAKAVYALESKLYTVNGNNNVAKTMYDKKKTAMYKSKMDSAQAALDQLQQQKEKLLEKYREIVKALLPDADKTAAN